MSKRAELGSICAAFAITTFACGGIALRDEPAAIGADASGGAVEPAPAAPAIDAAAPAPIDPEEIACRSWPAATPHRVEGVDCPAEGCSSCDDATDCEPGFICIYSATKGPAFIECRRRHGDTSGHPYAYATHQLCVQDCECDARYGDHCVDQRCAF